MIAELLLAAAGTGVVAAQWRHVRRVRRDRTAVFDQVTPLLADVTLESDGLGYPRLAGSYGGHPVEVELLVDDLTFRKLPVLWLIVTTHRRLPVDASLDVLLRPTGTEFFSPNGRFEGEIPAPGFLPAHVRVASPHPDAAPPASVLHPVAAFLSDPATKEALAGAGGIRIVRRIAEADPALYRVTRRAGLRGVRVAAEDLRSALAAARELGDSLIERAAARA